MVACQIDGVTVRHGATWTEEALAALPANDATHFSQHVLFHQGEYRGYLVSIDGRIKSVGQPLTQQPVRVQTGEQLIDEMRMAGLHTILDNTACQRQQLLVADSFGRQREIHHGTQIGGIHPFHHTVFPGSGLYAGNR